jgi:ATP-dependent RNA helicase DDX52/ROK1
VLDEADRLFDDDFLTQTDAILTACTSPRLKKALFSATLPSGVEALARKAMSDTDAIRCLVGCKEAASALITQELRFCANEQGKLATFKQFFHDGTMRAPCLAFVQSVERAKDLCAQLRAMGLDEAIRVDVVHAELSKGQRDEAMDAFRAGQTMVLVTTDALARGIDFKGVNLVVKWVARPCYPSC